MTYDEIPQNLVQAVVAIEDRRFFEHGGVDYIRMIGRLRNDMTPGHRLRGRLHADDAVGARILSDAGAAHQAQADRDLITFQLEHRFTKKQIFEMYANQDPPGAARQLFDQRIRRGGAGLLRQGCAPAQPFRVRVAGGHNPEPEPA